MHRAHRRDAVNTQKFFFRKNLYSPAPGVKCDYSTPPSPFSATPATYDHITTSSTASPAVPILLPNGLSALRATFPPTPSACSSHGNSRSNSPTDDTTPSSPTSSTAPTGPVEEEYDEFSIDEIINGKKDSGFPGLMGIVVNYLDSLGLEASTRAELDKSLSLISRRANGQSPHFLLDSALADGMT